ncbi:MAG: DinB family protein [Planctomycetota bacterium]
MAQWESMTRLFDLMRKMVANLASSLPEPHFNEPRGGSNSPKWITGHLALGMDFGLSLLGDPTKEIEVMMPLYGPGSPGGRVDDSKTCGELVEHLRVAGDRLKEKVPLVSDDVLKQPQSTPFLSAELPTVGDLLGHIYTTHLALHTGQLSQIRRELGLPSLYQF